MPQQRGLIDPKLYTWYELVRRRNVTGIILETKKRGRTKCVPGCGKASGLYRESEMIQTTTIASRPTDDSPDK